eukprot:14479239-Alexandrium_andersonii.AAC.1
MSASLVGSGDVYKRQPPRNPSEPLRNALGTPRSTPFVVRFGISAKNGACLLYTSDAADDM